MSKNSAYNSDFDTGTVGSGGFQERFSGISDTASSQIDSSPLIALGAGLALGAVLGAVLPASRKERELLGPLGSKINEAGTDAIDRSRGMAKQKFDEMAGDKLRELLGSNGTSANSASA